MLRGRRIIPSLVAIALNPQKNISEKSESNQENYFKNTMNTVIKEKQIYACPHGSSIVPVRPARKPAQVIGYRVVPYLGNQSRQILSQDEMWFTNRVKALVALKQGIQDDLVGSALQLFVYDKATGQWHYDGNIAYNWKN